MTGNEIGDAPVLPVLLGHIPDEEDIASVTADGAYDTRRSHETIASRSAQAVIPPRKNARPWDPTQQEPSPETKLCGPAGVSDGLSGDGGAVIIDEAASHRMLGQRLTARDFDR
jgi:hypothetical protein